MKHDKTTDAAHITWITRKYCKQHYMHKFDNLDEMNQFLENYQWPKLTQYEIDTMNIPMTNK